MSGTYWPWFVGGGALAAVVVAHWLMLHRMMAVSGRFTTLVNRLRFGPEKKIEMTAAELEAALLAATAAAFGDDVLKEEATRATAGGDKPETKRELPTLTKPQGIGTHFVFLVALVLGGVLSAVLAGRLGLGFGLRGEVFNGLFHNRVTSSAVLLLGGVLVGFGTRMAAGCTSGHGLCGVSRFQSGSLLATTAFFGTGVITSFLLGWLL